MTRRLECGCVATETAVIHWCPLHTDDRGRKMLLHQRTRIAELESLYETSHASRVHADTCVLRLEAKVERLRGQADAAEKKLHRIAWMDGHGCVTGDCPHEHEQQCAEMLRKELQLAVKVANAALADLEPAEAGEEK